MKDLLAEWKRYITEATEPPAKCSYGSEYDKVVEPEYTALDVKQAIACYRGKKRGNGVDFAQFLTRMCDVESKYNPHARNGQFLGAFQAGQDFYGEEEDNAINPYESAKILYDFFVKVLPSFYAANQFIPDVIKKYGEPAFIYLVHQQGRTGAAKIGYAAIGKEKELRKKVLDKETLDKMKNQNNTEINSVLNDPAATNQQKADKFITYFKDKYGF